LVVGEDIDPEDPLAVTYAFAGRNHPERGVWYFADSPYYGLGTEGYHSIEDYFGRAVMPGQTEKTEMISGSGIAIYSCLGLEEHVGKPKPHILTFQRAWPKDIKDKVLANWERWGFRTGSAGASARPTRYCRSMARRASRGSTSPRLVKAKPDVVINFKVYWSYGGACRGIPPACLP
ncbi:MAG: hypothetical protein JRD01_11935, partial [Deltaproteobacteria bacterium]|nr:hypothetical protein [Deltaproteobacteria bacterium]